MPAWADIEERTIIAGFHGRFIHSERMSFAKWRVEEGAVLPIHAHPHEQVMLVFSGRLEVSIEGDRHLLIAGDVLVIPANARHEGKALADTEVMDVFAPVREDYRDPDSGTVLGAASGGGGTA